MKQLLEESIHWGLLGKHPREAYQYHLGRTCLSRVEKILRQELTLNFILPFSDKERVEALLCSQFPELRSAELLCRYEELIQSPEEILRLYLPYLIEESRADYGHLTATVQEEPSFAGDTVYLKALGRDTVERLNSELAPLWERSLRERFGLARKFIFEQDAAVYEETQKRLEDEAIAEAEAAAKAAAAAAQSEKRKEKKNGAAGTDGAALLGKSIRDLPRPIRELHRADGTVTVAGVLYEKSGRKCRNGKYELTLCIHDEGGSIGVRLFLPNEKEGKALEEQCKEGMGLRVRGRVEYDTYVSDLSILARDLERYDAPHRSDEAPEKRVELHAHTKMSNMDGLMEAADLVRLARSFGHKAVAVTDHGVVQSFPEAMKEATAKGKDPIRILYGVEGYLCDEPLDRLRMKDQRTWHIILLVRTQAGMKNLYKLISQSHLEHFYKRPRMPRALIEAHREGLIIGSACEAGELFQAVLNGESEERLREIASFYDYLEIQPLCNNRFLLREGRVADEEGLRDLNRRIVALGRAMGKPVVATCDAHYANAEDALYRRILMAGQGYKDAESGEGLYFRNTEEMLAEFAYLGEEEARRVVIEAPNAVADLIEDVTPIAKGNFPPKIEGAEETLRTKCWERAKQLYGEELPEIVQTRLDKELHSIIDNGYAVMYIAAEMLVQRSLKDGYLVGSRGSVGSSLAATMAGITEVNPLPPHYVCPVCKHSEFITDGSYDCGADLPPKDCPVCSAAMERLGFNIPFETFLGFEGNKEPDIDLNFAGVYQSRAHKYVDEIFGRENVYKAGTISTVASKTAYGFVMKYYDEKPEEERPGKWEIDRLTKCCTGVRRTTGQHPGGIIIVPRDKEICDFCPVQHPANETDSEIITTHYDYHSIDKNLLKLDILGHDVPTQLRMLQDMTGQGPLSIPLGDEKVMSLFNGTEALGIKRKDYPFTHASFGIPEFGTSFVRQMLDATKPKRFADLVRISGFSHGTDVWLNNAADFIASGKATMKDVISTRDDIMNYLIQKGCPKEASFKIMEKVRKGKGVTDEEEALMKSHEVPDWYVESCRRIKYMFPKAHAVAYTLMSYRIAYYKLYYPAAFYAAVFTIRNDCFNYPVIIGGYESVLKRIEAIRQLGRDATARDQDELITLELAAEMYARGVELLPIDLEHSAGTQFSLENGRVRPPFAALSGIGETAAEALAAERNSGEFASVEEMQLRCGLNKTGVEALREAGVLDGLSETNQMSILDLQYLLHN